jgi:membrane protease YdiL (CAAX protease family)
MNSRSQVLKYFLLVFAVSYGAFLVVVGPRLLHGGTETAADAEYILFPVLVVGVFLVSVSMTAVLYGRSGVKRLFAGETRWNVNPGWYAFALLLCPGVMLALIFALAWLVSPVFRPNDFALGISFAIMPGFLEEFGWMGFAYPHMRKSMTPFRAAVLLGILWGLWHAPVVDFLGAAAPHRQYWLPFFLAFIAIVSAVRVFIVWLYSHTESLLLAQLTHVSLTGSLVMFDPVRASPAQEALWYALYGATLWGIVVIWIRPRLTGTSSLANAANRSTLSRTR